MKKIKFNLICCTINPEFAINFINSVEISGDYDLEINIGNSSSINLNFDKINSELLPVVKEFYLPNCSLSEARNILLKNRPEGDIIAFPDDDCLYPEGILEYVYADFIANRINSQKGISFNFPGRYKDKISHVYLPKIFGRLISFNFFVYKKNINLNELYFDEMLGCGAPIDFGEESEFISRIIQRDGYFIYIPSILIYHPLNDTISFKKNFRRGLGVGRYIVYTIGRIDIPAAVRARLLLGTFLKCPYLALTFKFKKCIYYLINALGKIIGFCEYMFIKF